jgi:uncharacterized protein (TIGR00369 family)
VQRMSTAEMQRFFVEEFPQSQVTIEDVGERTARVRQAVSHEHLRPGGTVSGPVLMAVADAAMYAALLGQIGPVALAVTTNLNINFLRKPSPDTDVVAEARVLKLGERLAVGEVTIWSDGGEEPVAHATLTYSIPPAKHR